MCSWTILQGYCFTFLNGKLSSDFLSEKEHCLFLIYQVLSAFSWSDKSSWDEQHFCIWISAWWRHQDLSHPCIVQKIGKDPKLRHSCSSRWVPNALESSTHGKRTSVQDPLCPQQQLSLAFLHPSCFLEVQAPELKQDHCSFILVLVAKGFC